MKKITLTLTESEAVAVNGILNDWRLALKKQKITPLIRLAKINVDSVREKIGRELDKLYIGGGE